MASKKKQVNSTPDSKEESVVETVAAVETPAAPAPEPEKAPAPTPAPPAVIAEATPEPVAVEAAPAPVVVETPPPPAPAPEPPAPVVAETPVVVAAPAPVPAPVVETPAPAPAPAPAPVVETPAAVAPAPAPAPVVAETPAAAAPVTPTLIPTPDLTRRIQTGINDTVPPKTEPATPADPAAALAVAVPDPLAALTSASLVESALNNAMSDSDIEDNVGEQSTGLPIQYMAFPQGKGAKFPEEKKYWIYVGNSNSNSQDEANFRKEFPFLWIDALVTRPRKGKAQGARLSWPTKPTGERDLEKGVQCQSLDGQVPLAKFIGNQVYDYRTGNTVRIGFMPDPITGKDRPRDDLLVCANCPLQDWKQVNGKSVQLCKNNWGFVLWDMEKNQMVKVSGGNAGVQMALEGRKKDMIGAKIDGSALPGIEVWFRETGKRQVAIKVDGTTNPLMPAQYQFVTSVSPEAEGEKISVISAVNQDGTPNPLFDQAIAAGQVKRIFLSVPTYPYAPEGRPEHVGSFDVKVYPIIMTSVKNNFKVGSQASPTAVPDFKVGATPLTPEQYAQFLGKRTEYFTNKYRDVLLGTENQQRVQEALRGMVAPQISMPEQPLLQPTVSPDIVEGEFTTTDIPLSSTPLDS